MLIENNTVLVLNKQWLCCWIREVNFTEHSKIINCALSQTPKMLETSVPNIEIMNMFQLGLNCREDDS